MPDITLKKGETVNVEAYLQDGNGDALDLSGGVVSFQARKGSAAELKIDRIANVVDLPTGHVRAALTDEDTDTIGSYKAEWRVEYAGGYRIVPEAGYLTLKIWEDLAP